MGCRTCSELAVRTGRSFSKKRKHFVTIGYKDNDGKDQVVVYELGKDIVRTTLPILEARSGKKIEYQDEDAKKASKGN